jgi:hypothetical protein
MRSEPLAYVVDAGREMRAVDTMKSRGAAVRRAEWAAKVPKDSVRVSDGYPPLAERVLGENTS